MQEAAQQQTRSLPSHNLRDALFANLEHPRWEDVAERCLSCGNCTSVCPTCFCHSETDETALDGDHSLHARQWDSCFTQGHSYIHGMTIRADTRTRYRQWLTHKLGSWHDQYGRSGCVGCGRCIAWCPVGIDITARGSRHLPGEAVMANPSLPHEIEVVERIQESPTIFTLRLRFTDPAQHAAFRFEPGQFNMLYLYGVGEVAISIVSDPDDEHLFNHTIREVGTRDARAWRN